MDFIPISNKQKVFWTFYDETKKAELKIYLLANSLN